MNRVGVGKLLIKKKTISMVAVVAIAALLVGVILQRILLKQRARMER